MTVYILSALLLGILAYAVYQLTKKSEVNKEIEALTKQDESYLLAELYSVNFTVWLCVAGGLLLTANYAINYFSGSEVRFITDWGLYQWGGALIGLVVTVSITAVQKILYASPTHHKAGLLVTTLILVFVIFSEIGSPIEKEEMKMTEKSQNSATYKAVVGAINQGAGNSSPSAYSSQMANAQANKAKHVFELGRCNRHAPKGQKRVQRCETYEKREIAKYQAQIDSYNTNMKAETSSNQATSLALVDKAKALEHNTDNHSGLIKFVKEALATTYLSAMMLASLILVVAFEAGFHFAGSRAGILKAALMKMGNEDIKYASELRRHRRAEKFKNKTASLKAGSRTTQHPDKPEINIKGNTPNLSTPPHQWTAATQFTSNENTGTHEKQFDLFPNQNQTNTNTSDQPKTGKFAGRLNTGDKGGVEVVQATEYETLKAEIENGQLEPTIDAIARRIHQDKSVNLIMPKCKKVAKYVVEKWQKENLNNRPSEGENVEVDRPIRKGTMGGDSEPIRMGAMGDLDTKGTVLKKVDFDKVYTHVKNKVSAKEIKLSRASVTKCINDYIKTVSELEAYKISLIDSQNVGKAVIEKLYAEGIIKNNPNYKNGLPKYLVA